MVPWSLSADLTPASGGTRAMTETGWQVLRAEAGVQDAADYVKHILNKHEGEAKFVGDTQWQEVTPDSVGQDGIFGSCFWQYQFCRQQNTRQYLWNRSLEPGGEAKLQAADVDWIMETEGNELTLLRCEPPPGGRPSSGGTRWFTRIGKYVTLAEMFRMGRRPCTCFDLYRSYCNLPTAIFKRKHGESRSAAGTKRMNAKKTAIFRNRQVGPSGIAVKNHGGRSQPLARALLAASGAF